MNKRVSVSQLIAIPLVVAMVVLGMAASAFAASTDRTMYGEGTGQALIYPFWEADGKTVTLIDIVNRLTPINPKSQSGFTQFATDRKGRWILVHFTIREAKKSEEALNFNICLSPGDRWTGSLVLDGGVTKLFSNDLTDPPGAAFFPVSMDPIGATNPTRGYMEAVMVDNGTNPVTGCDGSHSQSEFEEGDDETGTSQPLFGRAFFVNTGAGLASGVNAEGLDDLNEDLELLNGSIHDSVISPPFGSVLAFQGLAQHDFSRGLRGTLLGPWARLGSPLIDTQIVLTWPLGLNQVFNLCQGDSGEFTPFGTVDENCRTTTRLDFTIPAGKAMQLWLRNDEECVGGSPHDVPVDQEVNVITFSNTTQLPPNRFNLTQGQTCNGNGGNPATGGWFRLLFDANEDEVTDFVAGTVCVCGNTVNTPTCDSDNFSSAECAPKVIRVPRLIPAVGFVLITAPGTDQVLSALFPFQSEATFQEYDCDDDDDGDEDSISCGRQFDPDTLN